VKAQVASAHQLAQAELQVADDEGVDHVHAELIATAAAVLMRAVALELRSRRAARLRAEELRSRKTASLARPAASDAAAEPTLSGRDSLRSLS